MYAGRRRDPVTRKPRATYGFRFWHRGRLYQRKGFVTRDEARHAEGVERRRVTRATFETEWGPLRSRYTTWADGLARYAEATKGRATAAKIAQRLAWWQTFAERHRAHYLQTLTPDLIVRGARALATDPDVPRGPQTVKHYLATLRAFCQHAVRRWGELAANPVHRVAMPRVPRSRRPILGPKDRRALLAAAERPLRPLIVAALYTGMREGALLKLQAADFTRRPGWLPARDEKGDTTYWIPVATPLAALVRAQDVATGPLWRWPDGRPLARFPTKMWDRARRAIGRPELRFHDLRHLVGVSLAEAGVSPAVIQAYLGHASRQATEIYTRWITEGALEDAASTLTRTFRTPSRTSTRRKSASRKASARVS